MNRRWITLCIPVLMVLGLLLLTDLWKVPLHRSDSEPGHASREVMYGFIVGIKGYQTEYNRWPVEALGASDDHVVLRTRGRILRVLFAEDDKINPRKVNFFVPPEARKDRKRGFYDNDRGEPVLVDQWGNPFYYVIDINGDGKIPNPDTRKGEPRDLDTSVIAFSAGPDGNPDTWEDNILSWK